MCQGAPKARTRLLATLANTLETIDCPKPGHSSQLSFSGSEVTRAKMKISLLHLPAELLLLVANFLDEGDMNALAQANRRLYSLLNPYLYRRNSLKSQSSALLWAAQRGMETTARKCLSEGANIGVMDSLGRTPLFRAASKGHQGVIELLLETGIDVDSGGSCGCTPLSTAASNGREAVVKLLLAKRADVNSKNICDATPLSEAASEGYTEVVRLLLETGIVEVDSTTDHIGRTPFLRAASNGHEAVVKLLLETGRVNINSQDLDGRTPFWWATFRGHEAVVRLLLETGRVDVDSKDI